MIKYYLFVFIILYLIKELNAQNSECICLGITSLTIRYNNNNVIDNTLNLITNGQLENSIFTSLWNEYEITLIGTYGPNKIIGPSILSLKTYYMTDINYEIPIEIDNLNVFKCGNIEINDVYGSFTVINVEKYYSAQCYSTSSETASHTPHNTITQQYYTTSPTPSPNESNQYSMSLSKTPSSTPTVSNNMCNENIYISIVLDTSGNMYNNPMQNQWPDIKYQIKYKLLELLCHYDNINIYVSIYSFASKARLEQSYILLNLNNLYVLNVVIDNIQEIYETPNNYSNWDDLFTVMKYQYQYDGYYPDLILFLCSTHPTTHVNSYYVPDQYDDDIIAALDSINEFKNIHPENKNPTKIISIGIGDKINANLLSKVSGGYIPEYDYYLLVDSSHLDYCFSDLISKYTCCDYEKDDCGICYGNNESCIGCDGILNSGIYYDTCGVCGGDSSTCTYPSCSTYVHINVREETWLSVNYYSQEDVYEFIFHTNYLEGTSVVIGFDSYVNGYPRIRGSCDNRPSSTIDYCNYCDLFNWEYPNIDTGVNIYLDNNHYYNKWIYYLDPDDNNYIYYKANFTISELLGCETYHGNKGLIQKIISRDEYGIKYDSYHGTLYASVIKKPLHVLCPYPIHDNMNNEPYEDLIFSSHYNFDLNTHQTSGIISTSFNQHNILIDAKWVKNIWLASGDVMVKFYTRVDYGYYLRNARMLYDYDNYNHNHNNHDDNNNNNNNNYPIPFHLIYNEDDCDDFEYPQCHYDEDNTYCTQYWTIKTDGATGVMDFSGLQQIKYDIYSLFPQYHTSNIIVRMDLIIKRHSDPITDITLNPFVRIYSNDYYSDIISNHCDNNKNHNIDDCDHGHYHKDITYYTSKDIIYIESGFDQEHYKYIPKKILLCTGKNGNPVPYDVRYPEYTGCNTPYIDSKAYLLFDIHFNDNNDDDDDDDNNHHHINKDFNFKFIHSTDPSKIRFKLDANPLFGYNQIIQIYWESQPIEHYLTSHLLDQGIDVNNNNDNLFSNFMDATNMPHKLKELENSMPYFNKKDANYTKNAIKIHDLLRNQKNHNIGHFHHFPNASYTRNSSREFIEKYNDIFQDHIEQELHKTLRNNLFDNYYDDDNNNHHINHEEYLYHDNNPVNSKSQFTIYVSCPFQYNLYEGKCVKDYYSSNYGYIIRGNWWIFIILIIAVIISCFFVSYYSNDIEEEEECEKGLPQIQDKIHLVSQNNHNTYHHVSKKTHTINHHHQRRNIVSFNRNNRY